MQHKEGNEDSWLNPHCRVLLSNRANKAVCAHFCLKIKNYFRISFLHDTHILQCTELDLLTFCPVLCLSHFCLRVPAHVSLISSAWCLHDVLHQPQNPKWISPRPPSLPFWNRKPVITPPLRPNIHVVISVLIFPVRWPCCSSPLHGHLGSGREQHVNNTSDGLRFLDFFSSQSNWTFVLPTHFSVLYPHSICPEFFHQL